jgi:SAM-dependent methyltransferase
VPATASIVEARAAADRHYGAGKKDAASVELAAGVAPGGSVVATDKAAAEVLRVLRPGGRAVFVEPDAAADFADHPDGRLGDLVTPLVTEVVNPRIGRGLRRLAIAAGFRDVRTDGYLMNLETAPPPPVARGIFRGLVDAGILTGEDADSLVEWVQRAGATRTFPAAQVIVRALAIK